jgi:nucleoside-diphosphate-sugar epimerase
MQPSPVLILGGQGYVGSALAVSLQAAGLAVVSVDLGVRGTPGPAPNQCRPYQELTADELTEFGAVVLLAGHSSVPACDHAPAAAFANNVAGFVDLIHKLRGQKLIYASSISVYVTTAGRPATEDAVLPPAASYYDLHKQAIERYAALAYPNAYGLRFGTVCGPSPNLRMELLINSLVLSALRTGEVRVANREASRPLLGIGDLCRAVEAILTRPVAPGCYNLASLNVRIGEAADHVARRFDVPCREVASVNHYDIRVDSRRFARAAGVEFRDDLSGLVTALAKFYTARPEIRRPADGL